MHTNRKHIKYLILILPSKNETKKLAYINGKTMYHCGKCQDKFTHENSLIEHKRHSKLIVPELLVPELLVPELLVKEISTLKATNMITCDNHHKTTNADAGNRYQCHQCNNKFHTKETLQHNVKKIHDKDVKSKEG